MEEIDYHLWMSLCKTSASMLDIIRWMNWHIPVIGRYWKVDRWSINMNSKSIVVAWCVSNGGSKVRNLRMHQYFILGYAFQLLIDMCSSLVLNHPCDLKIISMRVTVRLHSDCSFFYQELGWKNPWQHQAEGRTYTQVFAANLRRPFRLHYWTPLTIHDCVYEAVLLYVDFCWLVIILNSTLSIFVLCLRSTWALLQPGYQYYLKL